MSDVPVPVVDKPFFVIGDESDVIEPGILTFRADDYREEGWDECMAMIEKYVNPTIRRRMPGNPYRKEQR